MKKLLLLLVLCGPSLMMFGCGKPETTESVPPPTPEVIQENEEMGKVPGE